MLDRIQEAADPVAVVGTIMGVALENWVILIFTIPFLIYRSLYWRQKWINEKNGGSNAEASHD